MSIAANALRRMGVIPAFPASLRRGLAGHAMAVPKADTSLDHVFGSSAHRVSHDVRLKIALLVFKKKCPSHECFALLLVQSLLSFRSL